MGRHEPDQIAGGTLAQMEAAVDEAALLHGATWGGWVDEAPWMPGITAASAGGFGHVLRAAIGPFVERYGDRVPPRTIAWLAGFVEELGPWFSEVAGGPVTITHADYRLDNLLFEPNGRAVVLDWQTAMRSDPATDLAILLATSLTIEDRRRHEDALLERYRRRLAETGRDIGEERLRTGYRAAMLWWMAMFANNLSAIEPADDRGTSLFESMVERTFAAADDHESGQLIGRSLGS